MKTQLLAAYQELMKDPEGRELVLYAPLAVLAALGIAGLLLGA